MSRTSSLRAFLSAYAFGHCGWKRELREKISQSDSSSPFRRRALRTGQGRHARVHPHEDREEPRPAGRSWTTPAATVDQEAETRQATESASSGGLTLKRSRGALRSLSSGLPQPFSSSPLSSALLGARALEESARSRALSVNEKRKRSLHRIMPCQDQTPSNR